MIASSLISLNDNGLTSIQEKYFSSEDKHRSLLLGLFSALKDKDPNATIKRTEDGGTGFTFICTVPSTAIEDEKEIKPIPTVLKWQNETLCKVEQFGARFFQFFNFSSPATHLIEAENPHAQALMRYASQEVASMESRIGEIPCIMMPRLLSNNLKDAIQKKKFQNLSESDQFKMLHEFGRIAAVDMFMSNDDRFIQFPEYENPHILPKGAINTGNVLLSFEDTKLKSIFPIDNCPAAALQKSRPESSDEDLPLDLFWEENDWENVDESNSSEEEEEKNWVDFYSQVFENFCTSPEPFAQQFAQTFIEILEDPDNSSLDDISFVKEAFLSGIFEQLKKMNQNPEDIIGEINRFDFSDESISLVKSLLLKNLNILEKRL